MLLLDGHSSHFSKAFIERAISMDIVILCYPPHATHILQGLDVVLFAVAKAEWTKSRDRFEKERGEVVTKESFLEVFGESYIAAFTEKNNKKAFEKTGVHPFNRSVIKAEDLAPSLEHSSHAHVPFHLESPIKGAIGVFRETIDDIRREKEEANGWISVDDDTDLEDDDEGGAGDPDTQSEADDEDQDGEGGVIRYALRSKPGPSSSVPRSPQSSSNTTSGSTHIARRHPPAPTQTPIRNRLRRSLESSSTFNGLLNISPSRTPDPIPRRTYIRPTVTIEWNTLPRPASSLQDEVDMLQEKLAQAKIRDEQHTILLEAAHSQLALLGCYAETCRNHAVAAKKKTAKKGQRVNGTGWARVVTDPEVLMELERIEQAKVEKKAQKEARDEERKVKDALKALEVQQKEGRALYWECEKAEHSLRLAEWEKNGQVGRKPVRRRQKDVWDEFDRREEAGWVTEDDL